MVGGVEVEAVDIHAAGRRTAALRREGVFPEYVEAAVGSGEQLIVHIGYAGTLDEASVCCIVEDGTVHGNSGPHVLLLCNINVETAVRLDAEYAYREDRMRQGDCKLHVPGLY